VGDGYGWWGVLPIVGVGMGRSYPMGMYPLPSLMRGARPGLWGRMQREGGEEKQEGRLRRDTARRAGRTVFFRHSI
jgi:hypothetical protein